MTKAQLVTKAQLYLDDSSELSTAEFSDLFDKWYQRVCAYRPWEFTKKSYAGTASTTVPYISLPSDFASLAVNRNYTDSYYEAEGPVVFVGIDYIPYKVVSWSDRRQYRNQAQVCWVDIVNSRLYFAVQPTSADAVEFDYYSVPANLADGASPAFPERFHDVIYHGMVADESLISQSDKALSYAPENRSMYKSYLDDMAVWNARLVQQ
jgi:hypothetical protein